MQVEDILILSAGKQAVKRENLYMRFIHEHSVNTAFSMTFLLLRGALRVERPPHRCIRLVFAYAITFSTNRMSMAAAWARVAVP